MYSLKIVPNTQYVLNRCSILAAAETPTTANPTAPVTIQVIRS